VKTAISIPDTTFQRAERRARELGVSRSELYSTAVEGWLNAHEQQRMTERIDEVLSVGSHDEDLDFLSRAIAGLVEPRDTG